jgi:hypothetical protein
MPKFLVRVRRLADDTEQDMSYKAFTYIEDTIDDITLQKKFELIGEVDAKGNLIPGSPNLQPQHRSELPPQQVAVKQNAAPVASVAEGTKQERKKPGPKTKRPADVKLQETQA